MKMVISLLVLLNILNFPQVQNLTETESLVLENLKSNKPINFINDIYPSNILSGVFVKSILINDGSIVGRDFKIKELVIIGAVVVGDIYISNLKVDITLKFHNCIFRNDIEIINTQLNKTVQIGDCKFDGNLDFGQSTFNEKTFIRNCTFNGDVNFNYCNFSNYSDILNSKFLGTFQATNTKFSNSTLILECEFYKNVNFNWATFEKLELKNTKFNESATFNSIEVRKPAFIENNIFLGKLDFLEANILGSAYFENNLFQDSTIFISAQIAGKLIFDRSVFNGHTKFMGITIEDNASFIDITINKSIDLSGSRFNNELQFINSTLNSSSNFEGIYVSGNAFFVNSTFKSDFVLFSATFTKSLYIKKSKFLGNSNLGYMSINGIFDAGNTLFKKPTNFEFSKIDEELILINAVFNDFVSFRSIEVKTTLDFYNAKFNNGGNFSQMKIGGNVWGELSNFIGKVDFYATQVLGDFYLKNAKFEGINSYVKFNSVKIFGLMNLENVTYTDSVDFMNLFVQSQFQAKNSKFLSINNSISFSGLESPGGTYFNHATFFGHIKLNSINTSGLYLTSVNAKSVVQIKYSSLDHLNIDSANIVELDLTATNIKQSLKLKYSEFNRLIADRINVSNNLIIDSLRVRQYVSFINSKVSTLALSNFVYPSNKDSMDFDGFSFGYITNEKNPETWKDLLKILNDSKFSVSSYVLLEKYYKNLGMSETADSIYISRKIRERLESTDFAISISNFFHYMFINYGRTPSLAFFWTGVVLIVGFIGFSRKNIIQRDQKLGDLKYRRFRYTLDVFLPVVNLKEDDLWKPSDNRIEWGLSKFKFIKYYYAHFCYLLLKISGWVLTIYLVISLTSLVK